MSISDLAAVAAAGPVAAKALRRTRLLADEAPVGRLFASIATLIDAAGKAETAFAAGDMPFAARAIAELDIAGDGLDGYLRKSA